jgi:hypothetical protein
MSSGASYNSVVMPALVAVIHACCPVRQDVDGRVKPGHDEGLRDVA